MSEWAAKRFWSEVKVTPTERGFGIQLDGRPVKTPAKTTLIVPTSEMAEEVAAEWAAVEGVINPTLMPMTRSANAALDKVTLQFNEVAELLAAYGGSDLLCYRADGPAELSARQSEAWDPLLDWAHETFGARLVPTTGLMPVDQEPEALSALSSPLYRATSFELTALHDLISLSGSLVLALAATEGRLEPGEAWDMSRIDEIWQIEQWGEDEEALAAAQVKRDAFFHAARFYHLAKSPSGR